MKHIIVLFTCLLGALSSAIAQEKPPLIFSFEQDTILAEPSNTFINFILVKNQSDINVDINRIIAKNDYPGTLLSPSPSSFTLTPGESKRFPVKFIVNQEFLKIPEKSIQYDVFYIINENIKTMSTNFYVNRKEDNNVSIYPFATENYLNPSLPQNKVSYFIENLSYSARQLKLSYRLQPEGLHIPEKEVIINLEAKEKKLIDLYISPSSNIGFNPDYQIIVNADDIALNKSVGSTAIRVIVLSSSRQMNPTGSTTSTDNSIEFTQNQMNRNLAFSQLKANSLFSIGNLQASVNTNVDYYAQSNNLNIYNTWIELSSQALALRLGNVYGDSYDYNISGKGAKLSYKPNDNQSFEILGSENDYSIYNNINNSRELARTFATRYQFTSRDNNTKARIGYVYNTNPATSINTNLLTLSSSTALNSIQDVRIEGGISNEQRTFDNLKAFGYSAGIYYGMRGEKWRINSSNFYSTPEYAGQRRGTINVNQSLSYTLSENKQVFLQYSNTTNQPRYLSENNQFDSNGFLIPENYYYGKSQTIGSGLSFNNRIFNFSISPQITEQKNTTNNISKKMLSYSLRMDIGTNFKNHNLNFSSEYGATTMNNEDDWYKSLRLLLSYRYKTVSLNAQASLNPQNIYEAIQAAESNNKANSYSIYSSYSFTAFNEKLKASLSTGLNYSTIYKNFNKNFNASIEYEWTNTWAVTASGAYSGFKSANFSNNNSQFKIGVKKYFRQATTIGNHTVKLKLFQDDNYNGVWDAKEKAISDEIIRLNSSVALTNKDGEVNYQNVMPGNYRLSVNGKEGLQLKGMDSIVVNRNRTLLLPMIQNIRLSGELKEIRQQYDTKEADIVGINIYAKNEKGEIFNTFVNPQGSFDFYLIEGNYTIYIENSRFQFMNPSQTVQAIRGEVPNKLLFEFRKKDTEIKIKKF